MAPKDKKGGGPTGGKGAEGPKQTIPKPSAPPTPVTVAPRAPSAPSGGGRGGGGASGGGGKGGKGAGGTSFTFNPTGRPPVSVAPGTDVPPTLQPDGYFGTTPPTGAGPTGPTGNGPTGTGDGEDSGFVEPFDPYAAMFAAQQAQEQQNVIAIVTALFKEYGLESLTPKIIEYVKAGYGADAIGVLLRDTPEYKARFPAMATLMQKKRAISEAEYIAYERQAAQLEKQYGLPTGMVMGNVTKLLENEVSATELNDRIMLASSASIQAPEDLKQTLQQYYNIGTGGLAAYFLDPTVAAPLLEKQFVSAQIGTEAVRQGVGLDVYGAQNLQSLGITQETARQGFQTVARDIGLTAGRGDVVTQGELIGGTFGDQQQQASIERARNARMGRFAAGGEFVGTERGVRGLASSAT